LGCPKKWRYEMAGILLIFAFSMSLVINLIEKKINPKDELNTEAEEIASKSS
jgi:hypothetical protein